MTAAAVIFVFAFLLYNMYNNQLKKSANDTANEVLSFRRWVSQAGMLWVEKLHPGFEDYLDNVEFTTNGIKNSFYSKNPALATRELSELFSENSEGITFRVTSKNYRNEKNGPDFFERESINKFENDKGLNSIGIREEGFFRYMIPIKTEKSCLKCHGDPVNAPAAVIKKYGKIKAFGYKEGEIRGILSIKIPDKGIAGIFSHMDYRVYLAACIMIILMIYFFYFLKTEKNTVSHRARAFEKLKEFLISY